MESYLREFFMVALAHALAVASPGPDFTLVLRQSLRHDRATALLSSWGIAAGILVHVAWALLGVALLIRNTPVLFQLLQYLAAAWLAWLGWQSLRARPGALQESAQANRRLSPRRAWVAGFLTNVLNAKATLFFLALFTVVISRETPVWVQMAYGLWMSLATGLWFSTVAWLFTRPGWKARYAHWHHWIERGMGLVLLMLAASMLPAFPFR